VAHKTNAQGKLHSHKFKETLIRTALKQRTIAGVAWCTPLNRCQSNSPCNKQDYWRLCLLCCTHLPERSRTLPLQQLTEQQLLNTTTRELLQQVCLEMSGAGPRPGEEGEGSRQLNRQHSGHTPLLTVIEECFFSDPQHTPTHTLTHTSTQSL
jgi:hypothetical protein